MSSLIEPIIHSIINVLLLSALGILLTHWITLVIIVLGLIWTAYNTAYNLLNQTEETEISQNDIFDLPTFTELQESFK